MQVELRAEAHRLIEEGVLPFFTKNKLQMGGTFK